MSFSENVAPKKSGARKTEITLHYSAKLGHTHPHTLMEGNCFVCFRAGWPSAENCAGPNLGGESDVLCFCFRERPRCGGGLFGWPDGAFAFVFCLETLEMLQGNEWGMAKLRSGSQADMPLGDGCN